MKSTFEFKPLDRTLMMALGLLLFFVLWPILWITRHPEMYMIVNYIPLNWGDMLKSFFDKYPPGGSMYRPLPLYVWPFVEFKLFGWNHRPYIAGGILFCTFFVLLSYILTRQISKNSITSFICSLFFFGYYSGVHASLVSNHFNAEYFYLMFYLAALVCMIHYFETRTRAFRTASWIFFILGLMSKEVVALLPLTIAGYLLIYRKEEVKQTWIGLTKCSFLLNRKKLRDILDQFQNQEGLLHAIAPHTLIFFIYFLIRIFFPILSGNFNRANPEASGLALNLDFIQMNMANIYFYTFNIPLRQNNIGDNFFIVNQFQTMNALMLASLVWITIAIFMAILKNRTVLFGLMFYGVNISIFLFFRAPVLGQFHILLSLVGVAMITGEMFSGLETIIQRLKVVQKIKLQWICIALIFLLAFGLTLLSNFRTKEYIHNFQTNKVVNLFQSIYKALPEPEKREPDTLIYIKNSKNILAAEKYDFFSMAVLPSYRPVGRVRMIHDFKQKESNNEIQKYCSTHWHIEVLEYRGNRETINVTNQNSFDDICRPKRPKLFKLPTGPPTLSWDMEKIPGINIADDGENTGVKFVNIQTVKGHTGKGAYFNGIDSYIQTADKVQGWKNFTLSFWVRPEKPKDGQLAIIMDSGHTAQKNFAFQTADFSGQRWVWHCNGTDLFFSLPLREWSHVVVVVNTEKGWLKGYLNGVEVGEINPTEAIIFDSKPLVFGKLSSLPSRFYRGTLDNVKLWKNTLQ